MTPLVSILIPTRMRTERLRVCLDSIRDSATSGNYEVVVRVHNSDELTKKFARENNIPNVKWIYGDDLDGFGSLNEFYQELSNAAKGHWSWFLNDDMLISGDWFRELILTDPYSDLFVQPETLVSGKSVYINYQDGPAHLQRNRVWESFGYKTPGITPAVDKFLHNLLVNQNGFRMHYLKGVTVSHQRHMDGTMTKERF